MELYEFSEDRKKILVYELEAIKEEIVSYKKENIFTNDFFTLETLNKDLIDSILKGETVDRWLLNSKNGYFYTRLILIDDRHATDYERVVRENLLRKYYNSECLEFNIVQVDTGNKDADLFSHYSLLPLEKYESVYSYKDHNTWYRYSNILRLYEDLVGLHYLEQGNFEKLLSYPEICKKTPFKLFDLSLKMQLPNRLDDDTIVDILGFDKEERIYESSKILTLYRNSVKNNSI